MKFRNILLIDDDEDDQEIFLMALKKITSEVIFTAESDASEALAKLLSGELSPDVIFLDLNMPIMNGQQFLVEIKKLEKLSEIPVIIYSTTSNEATIQLMKDLGAADFITKPSEYYELVEILKHFVSETVNSAKNQ